MTNDTPRQDFRNRTSIQVLPNPFDFEGHEVRIAIGCDGESWYCAKDACDILGLTNPSMTVANLDDDERDDLSTTDVTGRRQEMIFVSESGLYALIFNSRKPEARRFRKWVTKEVLPAIRKQGYYGTIQAGNQVQLTTVMIKLLDKVTNRDSFVHQVAVTRLRNICNTFGEPMPDLSLLGKDRNQHELGV